MARRLPPEHFPAALLKSGAKVSVEIVGDAECDRFSAVWRRDDLHPDDWAAVLEEFGVEDGGDGGDGGDAP